MNIDKTVFGQLPDGQDVEIYTLTNTNGLRFRIMNYGAIVVSIEVPDRNGLLTDVALGFDTLEGYLEEHPYFGAVVGRYANRIARGRFNLNGVEYTLVKNNGENHLHGGTKGFDKILWAAKPMAGEEAAKLEFSYLSPNGEEGYPGNLSVQVIYTLTQENELKVDYFATTDKDTVVNLTQHAYFNLAGVDQGDILGHEMMINANRFTPIDASLIPTGELRPVQGTPFDFTTSTAIGARIEQEDEQLHLGGGYDHNFVLNQEPGKLGLAARVVEPLSGRVLEVYTTEPGIQFYTGNFLDGTVVGKRGEAYPQRHGFCLETQHFPDSPNQPSFPSTVLKPGEEYRHTTVFKFLTQ